MTMLVSQPRSPLCRGWCGGERSAMESPAVIVDLPNGKKALFCVCCNTQLRVVTALEGGNVPAPNIRPGILHRERRFTCDRCLYDHVVIVDPRPV